MNGDFLDLFYCSSLSFYIKCDGARQVTFINAEAIVESSGNFWKLPWKSMPSLEFTSVIWTFLGHSLGTCPERSLALTNDPRIFVYYQNELVNARFVSSVWANA